MPQLDKFAFAPQVFWLVLVFFVLYLLLLKDGLATLYKILTFRRRLLLDLNLTSTTLAQEVVLIKLFSSRFLTFFLLGKGVSETLFKLLDSFLLSFFFREQLLTTARQNLFVSDATVVYVGKRQFISPALLPYSTIKF